LYRIGKEETAAVEKVINNGMLFRINADLQEVNNFEREMTEAFGVSYALCVSSGTAALACSLIGMGIGPGDEVMVPAYTFMATAISVLEAGAIPVLVEIDESLTIDIEDIKRKITTRTKAIIPVHICGFPCNMDAIMELANEKKILVLEDACQSVGGSYKGKRLGSIGVAGTLSFNHYKVISAGEGGAVLTNDKNLYERALFYHDAGCLFRPAMYYGVELEEQPFCGTQFRVSEITGAIMRVQLRRMDGILSDLRRIKKRIMVELSETPGIRFSSSYDLEGDCGTNIPFLFDTAGKAKKFAQFDGGIGTIPIDSDKHVYSNWTPVLRKKGAFNDRMNPFSFEENQGFLDTLHDNSCPNTTDYLERTVLVMPHPDMDDKTVTQLIDKYKKAASSTI
jgi:dTDP-4-amino-4,6-dideoxygalactose transaminase